MEMKDKLAAINSLLANPPAEFEFSDKQIEQIVRAEWLFSYLQDLDKGTYLENFLAWVGWCGELAGVLVALPESNYNNQSVDDQEEWKIAPKLGAVLSLYQQAWLGRHFVEAVGSDPTGLEMIRRFWDLKQYVLALVKRDFPGADFSGLEKTA